MKRRVLNPTTVPTTRQTGNYVSITPQTGGIAFTKTITEALKLKDKKINFIQDEEKPTEWFIEILKGDAEGFPIRMKTDNSAMVQSTFVCKEILKTIKVEARTVRFLIATDPIEKTLYAIITKSAVPVMINRKK